MYHKWTEEDREFIRVNYAHTRDSKRAIGKVLGVSEFAIAGQIVLMGICKRTDRRLWTAKEEERLEKLIPLYPTTRIAKMMHRSINAIAVKAKRLDFSLRDRDGWFTAKEVCEILGVDRKWLRWRIESGILKATHHYGHLTVKGNGAMYHIEREDLKAFIRRYPTELNGRNVDMMQIVDILAGVDI